MFSRLDNDEQLMEAFSREGQQEAFGLLYRRYFSALSKYIAWLSGDMEKGKDIAQNIFVKIYQHPASFDSSRNFRVWLFSIAKNQWKNDLRNEAVRRRHLALLPIDTQGVVPDQNATAEQRRLLLAALNSLPERHKEVFVLKYTNNLTIKEISEICSCREGTVKSRLFYALKKLKEELNTAKIKET